MPVVKVSMYSGRTHAQKAAVAKRMADALAEELQIARDLVLVIFDDIPREDWAPAGKLNEPA